MQEYLSEAVVLSAMPNGDMDTRVSLFTKRFGKLKAKAKSARKITSKLAPHLQPGNVVRVRIVEKSGLHVADALKQSSLAVSPHALHVLDGLLSEAEPDMALWVALARETFSWPEVLKALGWDPRLAECRACAAPDVPLFHIRTQEFFCGACASKFPQNEVLYIG